MKPSRLVLASAVVVALAITATMAEAKAVAYYNAGAAYVIDWQAKDRASVVSSAGARMAQVVDNGSYKLLTLDEPFSRLYSWGNDGCGDFEERLLTRQLVVRDLSRRQGQVIEMGDDVYFGGCQNGQSTPFGSPDDDGLMLGRLPMSARPPMTDLAPGSQLAGPSEGAWALDSPWPAQDVVTIQPGAASFQRSGHVLATSFSSDGWWVMDLGGGAQRAQTRMEVDARNGGETWLVADWSDGRAQRVTGARFVKPMAGASFGTKREAARMWLSGGTAHTNTPFYHYLYKDGTGERVQKWLDTGMESRTPITSWGLDGSTLWTQRILDEAGSIVQNRRWAPLRDEGEKIHWVMETYEWTVDGVTTPLFPPRVYFYIDAGKAVKPAAQ